MKNFILQTFFISSLFLFKLGAQVPSRSSDVMFQAFYWDSYDASNWASLTDQASEISENFTLVWLPPSGNTASSDKTMGYLPVYWFNQNSSFGSQAELKKLIATLKAGGTRTVADLVLNHRNGVTNWTDFPIESYNGITYTPNLYWICSTDEVAKQSDQAKPLGDPDEGEDFNGGRDLNHKNQELQNAIKGYMEFMKNEMGYDGWRYDMTKGFPGHYVAMYNDAADAYFSVGEYWDGNYNNLYAWLENAQFKSTTFDFAFKYVLNDWASSGDLTKLVWNFNNAKQPAGLIHNPDVRKYAVTFIDNHDTDRDHNVFSGDVLMANAFMLSSPGIPCVYIRHWQKYKPEIKAMIAARKSAGIHSESAVTVNESANNLYVATVTGTKGNLIVKLGSGNYNPPNGYRLVTSGNHYAIWVNSVDTDNEENVTIAINPRSGTYGVGQKVTLTTVHSNAAIYYTTDGSTPSVNSTKYSSPISLPIGTTNIKAIAISPSGVKTSVISNNYSISDKVELSSITVHFKAPDSWDEVGVYVWQMNDGKADELSGRWPGTAISKDNNTGYYTYTVTEYKGDNINVIFNNNGKNEQTVDLSTSSDISWEYGTTFMEGSIVKYNATVVNNSDVITSIKERVAMKCDIYPNPSNGLFYIDMENRLKAVDVISVMGSKVLSTQNDTNLIDLTSYPSGFYYVILTDVEGNKLTKTLLKK